MPQTTISYIHPALQKHNSLIASLQSLSFDDRLHAVKVIKNTVIGNSAKKVLFMKLGAIPKLVEILADNSSETALKTQTAIVLGSFAHGNDQNIESLVNSGVMKPLLDSLLSKDVKLLEASARALKILLQNPGVPRDEIFSNNYLTKLVDIVRLNESNGSLAELAASIIARCCENKSQQISFENAGAVEAILELLMLTGNSKTKEACVDAIAAFIRENPKVAKSFVEYQVQTAAGQADKESFFSLLVKYLRDKRPSMRLTAASCYVNLYRTGVIPEKQQEIVQHVLPILIKLFQEHSPTIREKAPLVFAYLVGESEELQKAASEADAVSRLSQLLLKVYSSISDDSGHTDVGKCRSNIANIRLCENVLISIAGICSLREECRKQVIDSKVLPIIVKALEHNEIGIRIAACQAARSLSRSVKYLRTALVDAGIAMPLFQLLSDKNSNVQTVASATLCNIVLDFSPMKKTVIENGGVEKLVELVHSMETNLRLNAVWALKNLLFQSDSETKQVVMSKLSFQTLEALMEDADVLVQEQAINLLRNLACKDERDINLCFDGFGEQKLMNILDKKLGSYVDEIILQTLYVIVNISTGSENHKNSVINNDSILKHVYSFMIHEKSSLKVATLWIVINLTWADETAADKRIHRLQSLGFEERLKSMVDDLDIEVKDRARTALQQFQTQS